MNSEGETVHPSLVASKAIQLGSGAVAVALAKNRGSRIRNGKQHLHCEFWDLSRIIEPLDVDLEYINS